MYTKSIWILLPILVASLVDCFEYKSNNEMKPDTEPGLLSFYGLSSTIEYCSAQKDVAKCVQKLIFKIMDNATKLKKDWVLNGFITLKKNENYTELTENTNAETSFDDQMQIKLKNLLNSRSVQLNLLEQSDEDEEEEVDEGEYSFMFV